MSDLISREAIVKKLRRIATAQANAGAYLAAEACEAAAVRIEKEPAVDAVEVVRCKDCVYKDNPPCCPSQIGGFRITDDWFCPMGVMKNAAD